MTREAGTSLREEISEEHRRLAPFFEHMRRALIAADAGATRDAFDELEEELERHLSQEDRLYYPMLASLQPEHAETLRHFVEDHETFRTELEAIGGWLDSGNTDRARGHFENLARSFAAHEVHEEEFLRHIDAELGTSPGLG